MSDFPLSEGENLNWELRMQSADSGKLGEGSYDPSPFPFWPEDSDEEISIQVQLSLNQYTALMSAIDIGAAIGYGDDSLLVKWMLWRNFQGDAMTFCEQMINCIENDEDTIDAISDSLFDYEGFNDKLSDYIDEHPGGSIYGKNQPIPETTKITTNEDCDLDVLWAQCRGIVEVANTFIVDWLEKWETYTNKGEVVSDLLNSIPLLAELVSASGVGGVIEYANDLVDAIAENYTADYDETYEVELSCELFCAAQTQIDCVLTISDIVGLLNERVGGSLTFANVTELIVSLTDQDITGINVADLYMLFFFAAMQIGNIVLPNQFGFETFVNIIGVINEPSDDWAGLCEECPEGADINTNTCLYAGQPTTMGVNEGIEYTLVATGEFIYDSATGAHCGPDGIPPDPFAAGVEPAFKCLIFMCKIGPTGDYFQVGNGATFTANATGFLYFSVNELYSASINTYGDNSGLIHVEFA